MNINDISEFLSNMEEIFINSKVFLFVSLILLISFFIKFNLWDDTIKVKNSKYAKQEKRNYLLYRISIEYAIAIVTATFFIMITKSSFDNYINNYIVSPLIGFLVATWIDNSYLIPHQQIKLDESILLNNNSEDLNDIIKSNDDNTEFISINISEEELIKCDDHNELFRIAINELSKNQKYLYNEIETHSEILVAVRDSMMVEKKYKLKQAMYECLDQGYATPSQNEIIQDMYSNYISLKGNGRIKNLYENYYSKIPIHWNQPDNNLTEENTEMKKVINLFNEYFCEQNDDKYNWNEEK